MMSDMNWNHVAHIIRDVFPETAMTVVYGEDEEFIRTLRSNEHSIGAFMVHTNRQRIDLDDMTKCWDAGVNGIFFGMDACDLFVSIGYDPPSLHPQYNPTLLAMTIRHLLKPNGLAFIVNPGDWACMMPVVAKRNRDKEQEVKRYQLFAHEKVAVYESVHPSY